jgi:hypothetical protein
MTSFSCYVVGATTLPIRCAEILVNRGHRVLGAVSDDADVVRWADSIGVAVLPQPALADKEFDYLFSINNLRLLPDALLGEALYRYAA